MKRNCSLIHVLIIFSAITLLQSCTNDSKREDFSDFITREDFIGISQIKRLELYDKLSAEQKLNLWMDKLNHLSTLDLADEKIDAINNLKQRLNVEIFRDIQSDSDFYNAKLLMDWVEVFGRYFMEEEGKSMFGSLENFTPPVSYTKRTFQDLIYAEAAAESYFSFSANETQTNNASALEVYDCDCRCSCRWGSYCSSIGDCDSKGVKCETGRGCGFFWLNTCNGLCGELVPSGTSPITQ